MTLTRYILEGYLRQCGKDLEQAFKLYGLHKTIQLTLLNAC